MFWMHNGLKRQPVDAITSLQRSDHFAYGECIHASGTAVGSALKRFLHFT